MNSKIEIIENQFDEELIYQAEELLENKELLKIKELSKNLWIIYFDKESLEVEIFIKAGNKTKFTCDCKLFDPKKGCKHVVAGLLHLRKLKTEKEIALAKKRAARPINKNQYNFKTILEQADSDDLRAFVHSYAKKHKDFALAIKVHFASKTETGFEEQKYKKLLSEAVKPKTSRHNNFTRKEWQNFRFLLEDFIAQTQDNLSQEQYHNSFIIFENCQDKISYVKYIFEKSDEKDLLKLELELLKEFELLLKRDLAPEFRLLIEKRLIELAQKSYYNPEFYNFISILLNNNGISLNHKTALIENFKSKIDLHNLDRDYRLSVILELAKDDERLVSLVHSNFNAIDIIDSLAKFQSQDRVELVDYYLGTRELVNCKLEEYMLLKMKQFALKRQLEELIKYFINENLWNSEAKFIAILKLYFPKKRILTYKKQIKSVISKFSDINKAYFYAHYDMYKDLVKILKNNLELSFIVQFDELLLENDLTKEIDDLYKLAIKKYLENHIGLPSREKMQALFFHLNKIGAVNLKMSLKRYIDNEFPHRYLSERNN